MIRSRHRSNGRTDKFPGLSPEMDTITFTIINKNVWKMIKGAWTVDGQSLWKNFSTISDVSKLFIESKFPRPLSLV